jgi:hypothetical protein
MSIRSGFANADRQYPDPNSPQFLRNVVAFASVKLAMEMQGEKCHAETKMPVTRAQRGYLIACQVSF